MMTTTMLNEKKMLANAASCPPVTTVCPSIVTAVMLVMAFGMAAPFRMPMTKKPATTRKKE